MKKLVNFVHDYIMLMILVFCSMVYGSESGLQNYPQKLITPPTKPVKCNNFRDPGAILKCIPESQKEDLYKSTKNEMDWILGLLSSYDIEQKAYVLWQIDHERPVGIIDGELFVKFVCICNKFCPNTNKNIFTSMKDVINSIKTCCDIKDKESFIIESYNIVTEVRYSSQSRVLSIWSK